MRVALGCGHVEAQRPQAPLRRSSPLQETTSLTYSLSVFTFIETKLFTQLVETYLTDDDYANLQLAIVANPDAGDVIRGSGGVRKLRWGLPGRGKRGGARVIYLPATAAGTSLDADNVRKERSRQHFWTGSKEDQGGARWPRLSGTSAGKFWTVLQN